MEKSYFLLLLIILLTGCKTIHTPSVTTYPNYTYDNYWSSSYKKSFDDFESGLRIGMSIEEVDNLMKGIIKSDNARAQDTKTVSTMGISILRRIHTSRGDYYLYFFNDKLESWTM